MRAFLSVSSVALVIGVVVVGAIMLQHGGAAKPKVAGTLLDRPVPAIPLIDQNGRKLTFGALRGKVVVLAPFLTVCHESCPLTTGAFGQIQREVDKAGLGKRVVLVEMSVDPWRDTPKRMRAFAHLAGIHFTLLTGSKPNLTRLWHFFGVSFFRQPEGKPADRDWLTGRPLTFDVIHSDALFVLDGQGHQRIVDSGMVTIGSLPSALVALLNKGRSSRPHLPNSWVDGRWGNPRHRLPPRREPAQPAVTGMTHLVVDIGHSFREGFFMFWATLWALVLGFGLSGVVQAFVSKPEIERVLGGRGPKEIGRATLFGAASSSCSYAAAALAKTLFQRGAGFVSSMVFMFASMPAPRYSASGVGAPSLRVDLGGHAVTRTGYEEAARSSPSSPTPNSSRS